MLKKKVFSSIRWTAASAAMQLLLRVAQLAILARLLSAEDFGLMAIVLVVLAYGTLFADMGVNSAFVQRQDVSLEQRSSLFWLNIVIAMTIAIAIVAISPLAAGFFGDERLQPLMMLSASIVVFAAFGAQIKMARSKELDFRQLVLLEILAALAGLVVAVAGALAGWGVYALVASGIVTSLTGTILAWAFLARGWRPMWRMKAIDIKSFLGFGSALTANNIVNQINSTIDIFIGGKLFDASQLGFYSVPRNLCLQIQMVVNPIVTRVGFPLIAQVQHDVGRIKLIYKKTMNMVASTTAPVYIFVALFSPEIVTVLLGPNWENSIELLRVLALWGGLRSLCNPSGSLLLGMGRAGLALKWNLGLLFIVPPVLWFGAQGGPEGMAWAMFGLMALLFFPVWLVLVRPLCHMGVIEYAVSGLKPFLLAGAAFVPAYMATTELDMAIVRLAAGAVIGGLLYLLLSYKFNREWTEAMLELLGIKGVQGQKLKDV